MTVIPLFAHVLDRAPGLAMGLPLLAAVSLVLAATRHEHTAAIRRATLEWMGWLCGVLGAVLVTVLILAWLS